MSETILFTLCASVIIMFISLSGALFTWKTARTLLATRLHYLITFAMGVFTILIFNLTKETLHDGITFKAGLGFILGGIFLEGITRILPKGSHHMHEPCTTHAHTPLDARRMMIVDAFHNVHDGLALAPSFLVSPIVGFGTMVGILIHEFVQEISEFFILKEAGYSTKKALLWNFLVSSTILIGIGATFFFASFAHIEHALIAFSAGGLTYVVLRDLAPTIFVKMRTEKKYVTFFISFCAGLILMFGVTLFFPETDEHEEDLSLPDGFGLVTENMYSKIA